MRPPGRRILWRNLRRRCLALAALVAYLAASFGLPVPVLGARKDLSKPYPCMNNPCGCLCAEDCWRHCCCTTPEERWAWAAANNVTPPDYAEKPGAHDDGAESRPCPHCHPGKAAPDPCGFPTASPLRCQGGATLWVTLGTTAAPPPLTWRPAVVVADRLTHFDQFPSLLARAPASPPPR